MLLIFAGTTEGRKLVEYLSQFDIQMTVSVATEYGKELLPTGENIKQLVNRLDEKQMETFMIECKFDYVIDATHPYAYDVTKNIKSACEQTATKYIRLLRGTSKVENCIFVNDTESAAAYLNTVEGNVLIATGSKELHLFTKVNDYKNRIFPRVLPTFEVLQQCLELGFYGKNLICMQGPFSEELNTALLNQINAQYMVTKESGDVGGFVQKLKAAEKLGVKLIVIGRPQQEKGFSYGEVIEKLNKDYHITPKINPTEISQESYFPMFVDLTGKLIKVFGAGKIAARRIQTLLNFDCGIEVISPQICEEIMHLSAENKVRLQIREYEKGDCTGAYMVLGITNNRAVNHSIAQECKSLNIPVSIGDLKEECSFYFPGIVKNGDIVIGVTTSGQNHHLAKEITSDIRKLME